MDDLLALLAPVGRDNTTLEVLNGRLAPFGLSITLEDARMLETRRAEALQETERVEFGTPAIWIIADAVATSPCLTQEHVADTLAALQDAFYALRDELPLDVPDDEVVEALRGLLDEWGDVTGVTAASAQEIMAYSKRFVQAREAERELSYRIADDEGRIYSFDPTEWEYDETVPGWNGEEWFRDWSD